MFTFSMIAVKAHAFLRSNLKKTMQGRKATHNNVQETELVTFLLGHWQNNEQSPNYKEGI